jgi:hypothetical protein
MTQTTARPDYIAPERWVPLMPLPDEPSINEIAAFLAADSLSVDRAKILQLAADIARLPYQEQGTPLYLLFAELLRLGVDVFDLVPCVLAEVAE